MTKRQKLYREYLRSDAWKAKSDQAKADAGFRCQAAWNGRRCERRATQTHHLDYRNIFDELPFDLMAVCDDCHRRFHRLPQRLAANDNQLALPLGYPQR